MKRPLQTLFLLAFIGMGHIVHAQTTVTNGNWSNPATWGGAPPMGSGAVVINHTVTLDIDYSHTSGSVTINASGALNGNSPMRGFALNYPGGTATLAISGSLNVARVLLISNTATNNGILQSDSLLNSAALTNNSGATITTEQLMNNTSGTISNDGDVSSLNFFNIESVANSGTMTINDFTNAKSFTNATTGEISVTHDFSNRDTIASPAIFTNDGKVTIQNDWYNGNQIKGAGRFCVSNNTWNAGSMTETFDFCDLTGGNIDVNTGTTAGTITFCLYSCSMGLDEGTGTFITGIFPNPVRTSATITTNFDLDDAVVTVYNSLGQAVFRISQINGRQLEISGSQLNSGLYFFTIANQRQTVNGKFTVE